MCLNISSGVVKCVALNEHLTRRICGLALHKKKKKDYRIDYFLVFLLP